MKRGGQPLSCARSEGEVDVGAGAKTRWKQGGCCLREVGRDSGGGEGKRDEDSRGRGASGKNRGRAAPGSVSRFLLVFPLLSATGRQASRLC